MARLKPLHNMQLLYTPICFELFKLLAYQETLSYTQFQVHARLYLCMIQLQHIAATSECSRIFDKAVKHVKQSSSDMSLKVHPT